MDLEAVEVADHQQRWVLQVLAVLEQLVIRLFQVRVVPFVLPSEVAAKPDIGPAGTAAGFLGAALKRVEAAGRVGIGWSRYAEHETQVVEVRLRARALVERRAAPLVLKLRHGERCGRARYHRGAP